jgi:hypothetical protein
MQTGDRLSYHPENIQLEITHLPQVYAQALAWIQDKIQKANASDKEVADMLSATEPNSDTTRQQEARYKLMIRRALIQVQDASQTAQDRH